MSYFNSKNVYHYIIAFCTITIFGTIVNKVKKSAMNVNSNANEEKLIHEYLLNESPLYGHNRPKIWIHSYYGLNARKWKDFNSRNTTDLNQPYIHLTIKSIINHCGEDFNICLIDDETFSKLIPDWNVNMDRIAEPTRSQYRELGMFKLLHMYGGMVVPNSFLCIRNMKPLYDENVSLGSPFICEKVHNINVTQKDFIPGTDIMGAKPNNEVIYEFIQHIEQILSIVHASNEYDFMRKLAMICNINIQNGKMNLVNGEYVGIKDSNQKPLLIEDILGESPINICSHAFGIHIPSRDILRRTNYKWFASLSIDEIMKSNLIISKYMASSIMDSENEYTKSTVIKCVVSI